MSGSAGQQHAGAGAGDGAGPWTVADAERAAYEVLGLLGHRDAVPSLLRLGENALFEVPAAGLLLRVARPSRDPAQVGMTVTIARTLLAAGFLTAEPADLPGVPQPVVCADGSVTVWRLLPEVTRDSFELKEFGALVRGFQAAGGPLADVLPVWDPLGRTRSRLAAAAAAGAPAGWIDALGARIGEVDGALAAAESVLGIGVVHGDAHRGNVLHTAQGPRLIDLDEACVGPREVDLAPTLVTCRRFGLTTADWSEFSSGYGADLSELPLAGPLVGWREVAMTVWLLQQYGSSAAIDAELEMRVRALLGGPGTERWHAF